MQVSIEKQVKTSKLTAISAYYKILSRAGTKCNTAARPGLFITNSLVYTMNDVSQCVCWQTFIFICGTNKIV